MTDCERFHHMPRVEGEEPARWECRDGKTHIRDRILIDKEGKEILRMHARLNEKGLWEVVSERL